MLIIQNSFTRLAVLKNLIERGDGLNHQERLNKKFAIIGLSLRIRPLIYTRRGFHPTSGRTGVINVLLTSRYAQPAIVEVRVVISSNFG